MKFHLKNKPQLTLMKLLKRRKMSLKQFILEQGITTYELLTNRCHTLGVLEPNKHEFDKIQPKVVTNQNEGIVVIEPLQTNNDLDVLLIEDKKNKRSKKKAIIENE